MSDINTFDEAHQKRRAEKDPSVVTGVFIFNKEGKILFVNAPKWNGMLALPGGHVDVGETLEENAIREIKEETNLDVELTSFICHKEIINLPGNYHGVVFYHLAKPKHLNLCASEDVSEVGFFSIAEIKQMDILESVQWVLEEAGFWK